MARLCILRSGTRNKQTTFKDESNRIPRCSCCKPLALRLRGKTAAHHGPIGRYPALCRKMARNRKIPELVPARLVWGEQSPLHCASRTVPSGSSTPVRARTVPLKMIIGQRDSSSQVAEMRVSRCVFSVRLRATTGSSAWMRKHYSWALVGHPSRRFLWILSRQPMMKESRLPGKSSESPWKRATCRANRAFTLLDRPLKPLCDRRPYSHFGQSTQSLP